MTTVAQKKSGLTWEQVCNDPNLQDLPYKIETNQWGQIVMSPPPPPKHGARQFRIGRLLSQHLPEGEVVTECPVRTTKGTKVPDVVWFSTARWGEVKEIAADSPVAPEICAEVLSPSNTQGEIEEKKQLYFEAGAEEVWTCDAEGRMRFFMPDGEQHASPRVPGFPKQVDI